MTTRFILIMQHAPTEGQIKAASEGGREVVQLADKSLLMVPEVPALPKAWFESQAEKIAAAVGGFKEGDTVHAVGESVLALAVQALARKAGCDCVVSVTTRNNVDKPQPDGSVKSVSVFVFMGFRPVYEF
jgi:hypothetical protein